MEQFLTPNIKILTHKLLDPRVWKTRPKVPWLDDMKAYHMKYLPPFVEPDNLRGGLVNYFCDEAADLIISMLPSLIEHTVTDPLREMFDDDLDEWDMDGFDRDWSNDKDISGPMINYNLTKNMRMGRIHHEECTVLGPGSNHRSLTAAM